MRERLGRHDSDRLRAKAEFARRLIIGTSDAEMVKKLISYADELDAEAIIIELMARTSD